MATQEAVKETVTVKVEKRRIKQFSEVVASTGYAVVEVTPTKKTSIKSTKKGVRLGNHKKGETIKDLLDRVGTVEFKYNSADELRKAAWQRDKK